MSMLQRTKNSLCRPLIQEEIPQSEAYKPWPSTFNRWVSRVVMINQT
uniref:Uncharacterized protein n=1 Tax=Nelumbo nucifera TaxID=4432 RepID=A0A822YXP0_NELNU|nr:TPA_asm: hypothetical protein HUJ06_007911 [Nelumbo nucifera]